LASLHAPLVASFLHRVFVAPNVRVMSEADLAEALEDELFALREQLGPEAYPKCALEYLNDWAAPDKGWLRKFYKPGTDQAQFDLTPATEKAIAWLLTLIERPFVGTESRLLMLFALLEQISAGTEADPIKRVDDLRRKREELDAEIARVLAGDMPLLDDTAVKDRFQQFQQLARELLADFREVENNFRLLDRKVRKRIALWEGAKGALLDEIMGERRALRPRRRPSTTTSDSIATSPSCDWSRSAWDLAGWSRSYAAGCDETDKGLYSVLIDFRSATVRYSSQVKSISYLKANAAEVLTRLAENRETLVITQNGEAKAVLQDVASFEETQETLALLKILALSQREVEAGRVKPVADVVARLHAKRSTA
jgi:prevent-host-death family protein